MTGPTTKIETSAIDTLAMETRYQRAQKLMQGISQKKIALNTTLFPVWITDSDCFWYEREIRKGEEPSAVYGKQYRLVNAKAVSNNIAFNHETLAAALAEASKKEVDTDNLPIMKVEMEIGVENLVSVVRFSAFDKRWIYETATGACSEVTLPADHNGVVSPNGDYAVFPRDYNLWLRDLKTGEERALTRDGEKTYVYGSGSAGWGHLASFALQVEWSPDSKCIFTLQRDSRQVKSSPYVHLVPQDGSIRPTVDYRQVAYPGDEHIEEFRFLVINVETGEHRPARYSPIPATGGNYSYPDQQLWWWATDSRRAYFVDMTRDCKTVRLLEFDTHTGSVRLLFDEVSETHICLKHNNDELPTILPLPESDELIWFSERTGWAHLYLYDLKTGKLKNPITSGKWVVRNIVHFDPQGREIWLRTAGRVSDRDPYYCDLVRVHIDSGVMTTLASSDHEYVAISQTQVDLLRAAAIGFTGRDVGCSSSVPNSSNFAVITRSRADQVPVSFLIDRNGREVLELEKADTSALPKDWQWPEPVKLLAADSKTDIYGLVYRPSDFSPKKRYPVVSHAFNDITWVPKGSFTNDKWYGLPYLSAAALAELGFVVVQIDGRGTPFRNKVFYDHSYGCLESVSEVEDHMAGIRQLAERYPYMDLTRVGYFAPWGGPGAVQGLLQYPDFYKVGVLQAFHDSRIYGAAMWGDRFEGLSRPKLASSEESSKRYKFPEDYAEKLQGKLLLMIGMLDTFNHPAAPFRLVEALQKANKDFDMIALPNHGHGISSYLIRRAWDYLIRHLMGVEPPKEFKLTVDFDSPGVFDAE